MFWWPKPLVEKGFDTFNAKVECSLDKGKPVLLLGLWDYNRMHDLLSFTILTTEPGKHFRRFHHRVATLAPDAESVEAYFSGSVDDAIELARGSNGEIFLVDPPEPLPTA